MGSRLHRFPLYRNASLWDPFPYNLDETRFHTFTDGFPACLGTMFGPGKRLGDLPQSSTGEAIIGIKLWHLRTTCLDRRRASALRRS